MKIDTAYRSPNFDLRAPGATPEFLILHYTECGLSEALKILTDASSSSNRVSAHYVIAEEGTIYQLVDEEHKAWHAGASQWKDKINLNAWSIGIELVHPGHRAPLKPYAQPQMASLLNLSHHITQRYHILPEHVLGHSDIAPSRKKDPGEFFDWQWLAQQGVGIWPSEEAQTKDASSPSIKTMQERLKLFGYRIPTHGKLDPSTRDVIVAFQRHFCPKNVTGAIDLLSFMRATTIVKSYAHSV